MNSVDSYIRSLFIYFFVFPFINRNEINIETMYLPTLYNFCGSFLRHLSCINSFWYYSPNLSLKLLHWMRWLQQISAPQMVAYQSNAAIDNIWSSRITCNDNDVHSNCNSAAISKQQTRQRKRQPAS